MKEQMKRNLIIFGQFVRKLRKQSKLSQDDVVSNSNKLTKATISDIENGKRNLSFTTLLDLAKGMKKQPKDLLDTYFDLNG
ncbi:Helix-turn-helix domain-containing protein [Sinomicrobium oceani]|uniref:Helix-turn-helix domain-containing protein n=1 Tax=Sinomicrobium oceani TaxID=1150368 RepID=A0A1K1NUH1_9FLAO|nr:helix-turn-helix transcriptional regulator [Sinomicrobium oceani]SFW38929.1 Helix-turn-helix domain-containing protein [Sinomicrobium oceani]